MMELVFICVKFLSSLVGEACILEKVLFFSSLSYRSIMFYFCITAEPFKFFSWPPSIITSKLLEI